MPGGPSDFDLFGYRLHVGGLLLRDGRCGSARGAIVEAGSENGEGVAGGMERDAAPEQGWPPMISSGLGERLVSVRVCRGAR